MPTFAYEGRRLAYSEYGSGPRLTVLVHGLMFSRRMHGPLAEHLAGRGHRVVTLDLLGHGESDKPSEQQAYSMPGFARQVVALLDHLGADQAVVGGTSLGANVTLEVAAAAPERVRGMVVEMPVLDGALLGCALAFTPLMTTLRFGAPAVRTLAGAMRLVPNRRLPFLADIVTEVLQREPEPSLAILSGLFFGRTAPPREERRTLEAPALVIGHPRDPVHPFADSDMLAEELPDARLLRAGSILEMRLAPQRLTGEIAAFVDECWRPQAANERLEAGARP